MNIISQSGQFISFVSILGLGFIYIILTWIFSSFLGDHADTHHDGDVSDHGHETVSLFSPKVIAIFMVGFGSAGCVMTLLEYSIIISTLSAIGGGVGLGGCALFFMRLLYKQQSSSSVETDATIGLPGIVTIEIPLNGVGEVSLCVRGQYMTYSARSEKQLSRNASIIVKSIQGNHLIVKENK